VTLASAVGVGVGQSWYEHRVDEFAGRSAWDPEDSH
jgi:hypothetical protein